MKNLNLALIVACVTAICLNAEVLTKTAEISLGGKKVGKIEVLTPVEVIAKEGAKAKINVKGAVSGNYIAQIHRKRRDFHGF